jgi:hypothetical protein
MRIGILTMITNGKPRPLGRGGGQNQTKYEDEDDSKDATQWKP